MTSKNDKKQESINELRKIVQPGDTVYTKMIHVSRSGMSRVLDVYLIKDNTPLRITRRVAEAIGARYSRKHEGVVMGGCGMDMGFQAVYLLGRVLFPDFRCLGENCPSNDHRNYRRTVRCEGTRVYNPNGPNTGSSCFWDRELRTHVVYEQESIDSGEDKKRQCPTCKGKGGWPNPKLDVQKGEPHSDGGYALVQKWLC